MNNNFQNLKQFIKIARLNIKGVEQKQAEIENIKIEINQNLVKDIGNSGDITITDIAQRAYVDVEKYITNEKLKAKKLLLCKTKEKVKEYFSLLEGRPINLLKENRDDLVRKQNTLVMPQKTISISPETSIIDIFNSNEIGHRLLITGELGSGKTITKIELAEALINQFEQDKSQPIPVLFSLSSWNNASISMFDWLVNEINKYGIDRSIGQKLINESQIILLLDELDEVNPDLLEDCFQGINNICSQSSINLVVCCRLSDYENIDKKLYLNGAICLQPLIETQIKQYIRTNKKNNYDDFLLYIQSNQIIEKLSKIPLFFSLCIYAYPNLKLQGIEAIKYLDSEEQVRNFLFNSYIEVRIESEGGYKNFSKTKIEQLSWLAKTMQKKNITEFCVEQLQPTWLESNSNLKIKYLIGVTIIFVILFRLVFWQIGHGKDQLLFEIGIGLLFGIGIGLRGGLSERIEITESFMQQGVRFSKSGGFIFGLLCAILGGLVDLLYDGFIDGITLSLAGFLIGALIGGIVNSNIAEITDKQVPNQGIKDSALNAVVFTLVYGFTGAFIFGTICWSLNGWNDGFDCAQIAGISFGLCAGMVHGGNTCIQHLILRFVLHKNQLIPWDIDQFLKQSASLRFLQRVGSQYRFIHSELRNYFAEKQKTN